MKRTEGGVTAAKGFCAAGAEANVKYHGRKDMAMIFSAAPCRAAGVFTSNVVKAAPVLWDREKIDHSDCIQAVVANSGIANACTGTQGYEYCRQTAAAAAEALGILPDAVLVASTGVIGMQLPIDRLIAGVKLLSEGLSDTPEAGTCAAEAIMTTDTVSKQVAVEVELGGRTVTIGGMAKGSGMIHPNMCTMLGFLTTDASISKTLLEEALRADVEDTFNMISVDGDMSTNDTLVILANGMAENAEITEKGEDYDRFCEALHEVTRSLARMLAGDGEGATTLFEAHVIHAATREEARTLAKSVICSSLTKAAIFGHDANWGRILCALGYSGVQFDPEAVELYFESGTDRILIYRNGCAADYSEEEATRILSAPEVTAFVDMNMGEEEATAWGCDLTFDYVKINADYRS